jgi:predicted ArsR family transcriptional regulator
MKTREQIEKLKQSWIHDGCWDLENTEGFEEYFMELSIFRANYEVLAEKRRKWQEEKHHAELSRLICPIMSIANTGNFTRCQTEQCTYWDSTFEKCLVVLPAFIQSCQRRRKE